MTESTDTVIIETSIEHAEAVVAMLDLATRINLGQIEEIASLARDHAILVRADESSSTGATISTEDADLLERYLHLAKSVLGHPRNGSFGIGAPGVTPAAKRAYEVKKAIEQAVHRHLRPNVRHSVAGDGVTVRYASGPVPTARISEQQPA